MEEKKKGKRSKKHLGKWQYYKLWKKGMTKRQLRERSQLESQSNLVMNELGNYCESRELNVSVLETDFGSIVQPLEQTPVWGHQNNPFQNTPNSIGLPLLPPQGKFATRNLIGIYRSVISPTLASTTTSYSTLPPPQTLPSTMPH